jgi:hypothetical protein
MTLASEKSAACHVSVTGSTGVVCTRLDPARLLNLALGAGMKADSPLGPEAVTRAMITIDQLIHDP